jgi:large subunit ribosomal protein L14
MIYKHTKLKIVDNSGAKLLRVFHLLKYPSSQNYSQNGELVLGSVIKYKVNKKVSKKQIYKALIITSKKNSFRRNGIFIKFDENRGVLFDNTQKMVGTRIFGPVSKEVKRSSYTRLLITTKKLI